MARQLDILALEPFFGGARRAMLEVVIRCSRHRWTLLKLPPRRIERRLTAAATWFGEQLTRHGSGKVDLLFTSEAMNLANLFRMIPALARQPSVVYFHSNQLPWPGMDGGPLELVNLNTATAATEIWFNSEHHRKSFLTRSEGVIVRHPELSNRSPLPAIRDKARLMYEPIDLGAGLERKIALKTIRDPRTIFAETRDADVKLLNQALLIAAKRQKFKLITVGPVEQLAESFERNTVSESDDMEQLTALNKAGIFLSVRRDAASDYQAMRALVAGCRPLFPSAGCYLSMLPDYLHADYIYNPSFDELAEQIERALTEPSDPPADEFRQMLRPHEALIACRAIDERLQELAEMGRDRPTTGVSK